MIQSKHIFSFKNVKISNIDNTFKIALDQGGHGYDFKVYLVFTRSVKSTRSEHC